MKPTFDSEGIPGGWSRYLERCRPRVEFPAVAHGRTSASKSAARRQLRTVPAFESWSAETTTSSEPELFVSKGEHL